MAKPRSKRDVAHTITERGARYGRFDMCAMLSRHIKRSLRCGTNWSKLADDQAEALDMIALKAARILNGDANHADSWHDIAGYAKLIADRLETGVSA